MYWQITARQRCGCCPAPETGSIKRCFFAKLLAPLITEHPMTALERRSVTSLALLYNFRMLGLFMVLPLLALYAADFEGATPALIGMALGVYGLS